MGQHAPEPWTICNHGPETLSIQTEDDECKRPIAEVSMFWHLSNDEANPRYSDDAHRIVACVNGCAGLNPAAYRQVVEALKVAQKAFTLMPNPDAVPGLSVYRLVETALTASQGTT